MTRSDRYKLPDGEWACTAVKCDQSSKCMRALAAIRPGQPVEDGMYKYAWTIWKPCFMDRDDLKVVPVPKKPLPPVKGLS